ncbi:hypothetical protein I316_06340 [Kwoniella heveanensis BCC8398]|uniref:Uncharacterized protein n=1 Tax=Kwoniella heveanensis BCC8398 TaxID=1296120 RepID=A0A1B9GLQ9_9TREE|nr:hypothetical protein I316_06340 [Kwoniella heveanensis BCC8398]
MSSYSSSTSQPRRLGIPSRPKASTTASSTSDSSTLPAQRQPRKSNSPTSTGTGTATARPFISKIRPPTAATAAILSPLPRPIKPHPRTTSLASRPKLKQPSGPATSAIVTERSIPILAAHHRKTGIATANPGGASGTVIKRPTLRRTQHKAVIASSVSHGTSKTRVNMDARTRMNDANEAIESGRLEFPQPRVSFLTPREVWSPLATPIPGLPSNVSASSSTFTSTRASAMPAPARMKMASKTNIPKYQLRDPGVTSTSSGLPKPARPRPPSLQPCSTNYTTSSIPTLRPVSQPPPSNVSSSSTPSLSSSSMIKPTVTDAITATQNGITAPASASARRPPGIGTMIRNRAAASPPSQGEKLASLRPANQPSSLAAPTTDSQTIATGRRVPSHSRNLSEPAFTIEPFIDRQRPVSWNPAYDSNTISYQDGGTESMLEAPLLYARMGSNASITSSATNCSSASSLTRHRAIRANGKGRGRSSRIGSAKRDSLSGDWDNRYERTLGTPSEELDGEGAKEEDDETESTISEASIRTAATINMPNGVSDTYRDQHPLTSPCDLLTGYNRPNFPSASFTPYAKESKPASLSIETDDNGLNLDPERNDPDTSMCAPYLVPAAGPRMTLEWESDGNCNSEGEIDEAERVWRELESKLGRKVRGRSLRRGRWVVRPVREELGGGEDVGVGMEKTSSGFSISYYVSSQDTCFGVRTPQEATEDGNQLALLSSEFDVQATALFDMSAPLIPSVSASACTPWNTPCMNKETLRRSRRVKKKFSASGSGSGSESWSMGMSMSTSCSSEAIEGPEYDEEESVIEFYDQCEEASDSFDKNEQSLIELPISPVIVNSFQENITPSPEPQVNINARFQNEDSSRSQDAATAPSPATTTGRPGPVYRLDSHVISALSALKGVFDSPELDHALTASSCPPYTLQDLYESESESESEGGDDDAAVSEGLGLGLGVPLRLDSIYHLPVLSPRLRPSSIAKARADSVKEQQSRTASSLVFRKLEGPVDDCVREVEAGLKRGIVDSPTEMCVVEGSGHPGPIQTPRSAASASDSKITLASSTEKKCEDDDADLEEMIIIRDLDTGVTREVRVDSLVNDMALH